MSGEAHENTPGVDFAHLILGFSSAALHYLGESIEEDSASTVNLPLAQQNIDIIAMLQNKTAGNLTTDEAELIEKVLQEVRAKYDAAARGASQP